MYIRELITEFNKHWNIRPTTNRVCGFQQSVEDMLHVRTVYLHQQAPPNVPFYHTKAVNVKLSGDGTNIRHRLHVVNLHSHYSQRRPIGILKSGESHTCH